MYPPVFNFYFVEILKVTSFINCSSSAIYFISKVCSNLPSSLSRLQTIFARFDEALNSGNMALSPGHGQCLSSFILFHLYCRATKLSLLSRLLCCCQGVSVFDKKAALCVCACACVCTCAVGRLLGFRV